jgi:hypothetical protein
MGMFDTIYFDKKYACPICNAEIDSVQTKEFENLLNNYYVKDCISHAEDVRIIKGELFCDACSKHIGKNIYIVVARGILLGITDTLEDARNLLNSLNLGKLTLWYHDLYQKYINERKEKKSYRRFLSNLCNWYNKGLYKKPDEQITEQLWLMWSKRYLKGALNPIESIERFLTSKKMEKALNKLWNEGQEILDIYYPEDIDQGEELWSVDVYQDELNERCHLNWTWTVISKKQLELDSEKEDHQPGWVIVMDAPFSDEVVREAIEKWLRDNGYKFEVRMISFEEAKGSGMVKKLREMVEIKKEETIPFETLEKQLAEETIKETAGFIVSKKDRKRVFYYKGFYGSLIPDVENDRLLGKIEDIDKDIVYEGKTVKECEQKFREAIDQYLT